MRIIILAFCFIALLSCKQKNKVNTDDKIEFEVESFDSFYNKFYTDSTFQLDRIKFPMRGLNTDDQAVDDDKYYYWQKDKWELNHMPNKKLFDVKTIKTDTMVTEQITSAEWPGLVIKSQFKKVNNKWYLVYFENGNL